MLGHYKEDLKTIIGVVTLILMVFGIAFLHSDLFNAFACLLCIANFAYSLTKKIQYRLGLTTDILYPTINDSYFKSSAISIGVIVEIGTFIVYKMDPFFNVFILFYMLIGLLLIFNGVYSLPNGELSFSKGALLFKGMDKPILINEILTVKIHKSSIVVFSSEEAMTRIVNLDLDEKYADIIKDELIKNGLNADSIIVNLVD